MARAAPRTGPRAGAALTVSAPRESRATRRTRAAHIVRALRREYADADCELDHRSSFELLAATVLSAQCTDERVNRVTPALFARYPDAVALARADLPELEELIRPTGFFRNKARALAALGQALVDRHGGEVPAHLDDLVALPGVGRKTASVVLGTWFGQPAIPVDTHVARLAGRLGLSVRTDPGHIETDLAETVDRADWTFASHALILHGRRVCHARKPNCCACVLAHLCPSAPPSDR